MNLRLNIVPELTGVCHALTNREKQASATGMRTVFYIYIYICIYYIPNNMYTHSYKAFAPSTAITRVFTQKDSYRLTNRVAVIFFLNVRGRYFYGGRDV